MAELIAVYTSMRSQMQTMTRMMALSGGASGARTVRLGGWWGSQFYISQDLEPLHATSPRSGRHAFHERRGDDGGGAGQRRAAPGAPRESEEEEEEGRRAKAGSGGRGQRMTSCRAPQHLHPPCTFAACSLVPAPNNLPCCPRRGQTAVTVSFDQSRSSYSTMCKGREGREVRLRNALDPHSCRGQSAAWDPCLSPRPAKQRNYRLAVPPWRMRRGSILLGDWAQSLHSPQ